MPYIHYNEKDKFVSLYNIGNSCYLNSALQCLLNSDLLMIHLKESIDYFKKHSQENLNNWILVNTFYDLTQKRGTKVAPVSLKQVLSRYNSDMFGNKRQQDCHECLVSILDILHEESKNINLHKLTFHPGFNKKTEKSNKQWLSFNKVFGYSFITHLFSGQFISTTFCTKCFNENHNFESFNNITLNIPNKNDNKPPDIKDCFYKYFESETLDELIECDNCPRDIFDNSKKRTKMKKRICIWRFPKILVLALKRYPKPNFRDNSKVGINGVLRFQVENTGEKLVYDLKQIVNHEGSSPYGGHYTVINIDSRGNWTMIDDENVTEIPLDKRNRYSSSAYILVYEIRS